MKTIKFIAVAVICLFALSANAQSMMKIEFKEGEPMEIPVSSIASISWFTNETPDNTGEPKIYGGNIVLDSQPDDPTDIETIFTSSLLNSNISNNYLQSYELSSVLSTVRQRTTDSDGTTYVDLVSPQFITTDVVNDGMYTYHIILVPEEYLSEYDVLVGDDITNSGTLLKDTSYGRIPHLDGSKTFTFNSTVYHAFGYYIKDNTVLNLIFQFTLTEKE